jgi:hypothetical protein
MRNVHHILLSSLPSTSDLEMVYSAQHVFEPGYATVLRDKKALEQRLLTSHDRPPGSEKFISSIFLMRFEKLKVLETTRGRAQPAIATGRVLRCKRQWVVFVNFLSLNGVFRPTSGERVHRSCPRCDCEAKCKKMRRVKLFLLTPAVTEETILA